MIVTNSTLGDALRAEREKRRLSVKAVCDALQMKQPYLSEIETGRRNPHENVISTFADYYGLEKSTLMAMAGRFTNSAERWLRSSPEAVKLVERMAAENWDESRINAYQKQS